MVEPFDVPASVVEPEVLQAFRVTFMPFASSKRVIAMNSLLSAMGVDVEIAPSDEPLIREWAVDVGDEIPDSPESYAIAAVRMSFFHDEVFDGVGTWKAEPITIRRFR